MGSRSSRRDASIALGFAELGEPPPPKSGQGPAAVVGDSLYIVREWRLGHTTNKDGGPVARLFIARAAFTTPPNRTKPLAT